LKKYPFFVLEERAIKHSNLRGRIEMEPNILFDLYDKDLIAYGTGTVGKMIIPYLMKNSNIRLCGVTNSRVTADYEGAFLDTGLPIRSLQAWSKLLPKATILITGSAEVDEICTFCKDTGFQDVRFTTPKILKAAQKDQENIAAYNLSKNMLSLCLANELHDAHKASFSEFKGCNKGKTVAVVGSGPSLNYYTQIEGIPHIGVNATFLKENLTLDYYFTIHHIPELCEKLKNYNFIKFFCARTNNSTDHFPEYILEENGGRIFFNAIDLACTKIHTNIEYYPLMGGYSVIFSALHFALYTRPKRILLIGCDCSKENHFDGSVNCTENYDMDYLFWIDQYHELKKFTSIHYPDTQIISVNPVGLKGMFHDVYTESYLNAHTDIDRTGCEMLVPINYI